MALPGHTADIEWANATARGQAAADQWQVAWHENNGTPVFINSSQLQPASKVGPASGRGSMGEAALALIEARKGVFRLEHPREELAVDYEGFDGFGNHHVRLQQQFRGVPMWNQELVVHFDPSGQMYAINGRYAPTPSGLTDTVPKLTAAAAANIAEEDLSASTEFQSLPGWAQQLLDYYGPSATQCLWMDPQTNAPHLVWHVELRPNMKDRWYYFVDAHTGRIIQHYNATNTAGATTATAIDLNGVEKRLHVYEDQGFFYLIDASRPMFRTDVPISLNDPSGAIWTIDARNSDLDGRSSVFQVTSENNEWDDPSAVSAHDNTGTVFEYYQNTHGRLAIDDAGGTMISIIHVTQQGQPLANAFWNGRFMAYGDGGRGLRPLAGGLDVAAHEMTHGVIQRTINLEYAFQSGALNESFADVFGAMVDRDDWLIGEDIVGESFAAGALRDMADPTRGRQPAHMSDFAELSIDQDNGGVHVNSGIPNRACFLIAEAIGREKTEQIYYRIMVARYLNSQANFVDMRLAAMRSAGDLFGNPSAEVDAVEAAFDAVGIVGDRGLEAPVDVPTLPGEDWIAIVNSEGGDNSLYLARPEIATKDDIVQLSPTQVYTITGNAVTVAADGSFLLFVDTANNVRFINTDGSGEVVISDAGIWSSIALSPDGKKLAATTTRREPTVFLFNLGSNEPGRGIDLYNPTTQEDVEIQTVQFPDALDWDINSEFLIYDAFNSIPQEEGDELSYWDVNILNVATEVIIPLFPPMPRGHHLGNPSFSNTNGSFVVFDLLNEETESNEVWVYDLFAGAANSIQTTNTVSYPSFSPDDSELIFQEFDEDVGDLVVRRIPLAEGRLEAAGPTQPYLLEARTANWFSITEDIPTAVEETGASLPLAAVLEPNYPNPFNAETVLRFHLPVDGTAELVIYDVLGRRVRTLTAGFASAGNHLVRWDARDENGHDVATGVYFAHLTTTATGGAAYSATIKMVLTR